MMHNKEAVEDYINFSNESDCPPMMQIVKKRPPAKPIKIYDEQLLKDGRYQCRFCERIYINRKKLRDHQNQHLKLRPYLCVWCRKCFTSPSALKTHERKHTGEKPYECLYCDVKFTQLSGVHHHCHNKHPGKKAATKKDEIKHACVCDLCGKTCHSHRGLQIHLSSHSREKRGPAQCGICNKILANHSHLKEHMLTHTGERAYVCIHCGQRFTTERNCKIHERIHTGEKPFKCKYCAQGFTQHGAAQRHEKFKHTGDRSVTDSSLFITGGGQVSVPPTEIGGVILNYSTFDRGVTTFIAIL